jgi:hypothetical protein
MTIELDLTKAGISDLTKRNIGTAMNESEIVLTSGIERAIEDLAVALMAENREQREQFKLAFGAVLFRLHQPHLHTDLDMEPDSHDELDPQDDRYAALLRCD